MKEYELINPSDPYTFLASSKEVAALAVASVSVIYGAKSKDGEEEIPIFIVGGFEEWYEQEFGRDYESGVEALKSELADALSSFMYGGFEDRERYELALSCITEPDKKEEFIVKWNDGRSSLNDIGTYCHKLAKKLNREDGEDNGTDKLPNA